MRVCLFVLTVKRLVISTVPTLLTPPYFYDTPLVRSQAERSDNSARREAAGRKMLGGFSMILYEKRGMTVLMAPFPRAGLP